MHDASVCMGLRWGGGYELIPGVGGSAKSLRCNNGYDLRKPHPTPENLNSLALYLPH